MYMKKQLIELLICPRCLPAEHPLELSVTLEADQDIESGTLTCPTCSTHFPIEEGVAHLTPEQGAIPGNKYEDPEVVSSYLWSHFADIFGDDNSSKAYKTWFLEMEPHAGIALDAGGAVGRFALEMSTKCDFAIGIDTSVAFIKAARQLMKSGEIHFQLKDEGSLTRDASITLPDNWQREKVEFFVGDALALPLRKESITSFASLNLIDKVPSPIGHLREMNRVMKQSGCQFLLSDPFSWSLEAAQKKEWLGGTPEGPYRGKGIDNIKLFLEEGIEQLGPAWQVKEPGNVWWKIRTHTNHYELIRSCYLKAERK